MTSSHSASDEHTPAVPRHSRSGHSQPPTPPTRATKAQDTALKARLSLARPGPEKFTKDHAAARGNTPSHLKLYAYDLTSYPSRTLRLALLIYHNFLKSPHF